MWWFCWNKTFQKILNIIRHSELHNNIVSGSHHRWSMNSKVLWTMMGQLNLFFTFNFTFYFFVLNGMILVRYQTSHSVFSVTSIVKLYLSLLSFSFFISKGRVQKKQKKIWIYPFLGGWVFQDGDNIHKKQKKTCL